MLAATLESLESLAHKALAAGAICVVSGTAETAGALALCLAEYPLLLIDGRYDGSPRGSRDPVRCRSALQLRHGQPLPGSRSVGSGLRACSGVGFARGRFWQARDQGIALKIDRFRADKPALTHRADEWRRGSRGAWNHHDGSSDSRRR